uniref:Guanylate kinase-like domain-containing protein n=1 Tax=Mucochytrium quahogii TaxID=96639 RepID=A0A7S2RVI6_9STRA|mmetsp:Transcript_9975/g.16325  ORF Transcript_9975/g.16325 Transcript_9975/m.16325 type:complete len:203 (+) Transcript_9975:117-725(+)
MGGGRILMLCGPSAVGKSTLCKLLLADYPKLFSFGISHTTRSLRESEVDGVHYIKTTKEQMERDVREGKFAEHARIHDELYGTSFSTLEAIQNQGKIALLDVDLHGVRSIKATDLDSKCVGIVPPTFDILEERLRDRKSETEEEIQLRLERALMEIEFCNNDPLVDELIINFNSWTHSYPLLKGHIQEWWPDVVLADKNNDD